MLYVPAVPPSSYLQRLTLATPRLARALQVVPLGGMVLLASSRLASMPNRTSRMYAVVAWSWALLLAALRLGMRAAARIEMMLMTTSSSIRLKPLRYIIASDFLRKRQSCSGG